MCQHSVSLGSIDTNLYTNQTTALEGVTWFSRPTVYFELLSTKMYYLANLVKHSKLSYCARSNFRTLIK